MSIGDRLRYVLVTGCGLGLAPVASGTFGTVAGVVPAVLIAYGVPEHAPLVLWLLAAGLLGFGCAQTAFTARVFGKKDPGAFVLDEVVGYLVTVAIFLTVVGPLGPTGFAVAFFAFRAFDILKVQPAKRLEELPGAAGIMLDDVAAGVWAGLLLVLVHTLGIEF